MPKIANFTYRRGKCRLERVKSDSRQFFNRKSDSIQQPERLAGNGNSAATLQFAISRDLFGSISL